MRIAIIMSCMAGLLISCTSVHLNKASKKHMEAWIHFHPPLPKYLKETMEFGRRAREAGYTTVLIRLLYKGRIDRPAACKVIKYFKHDLGLNVIPEIKLLGKSHITFGKKFLKLHPELFVGDIIDPYAIYKGKPAFDSLIIPLIDEHIKIFDNPEYFLLGWDEYNTDNIKKVAERNNRTVKDVWAGTLNRVSEYLLSRNITPIIFGDQLLSKQLAKADNPLNYPPDKRFENYSAVHGKFPKESKVDLINFVKDIKHKNKIIVADWHYAPEKEYPSVDYFKWLGFKEVIPVTWGLEENMKYFSEYAEARGIKTMMASVWHYFFHPTVRHLLWPTVYNSIYYFRNPNRNIPDKPKIIIKKNREHVIYAQPGDTLILTMLPSGEKVSFDIYPFDRMLRKNVISLESDKNMVKWKIPNKIREGLWTIQGYSMKKDGYLLHGMLEGGLYIGTPPLNFNNKLNEQNYDDLFMHLNFADCIRFGKGKQYLPIIGKSNVHWGVITGKAEIINNALICKNGGILIPRSKFNSMLMSGDKTVMIEFSMDKYPGEKQEWSAILTWVNYGKGFRIIVWRKRLYVQIFGRDSQRVYLISKNELKTHKKYQVVFNMNKKYASLYINGKKQVTKSSIRNKIYSSLPLCIGFSYTRKREAWKYFSGKIYSFSIWNKFVSLKDIKKCFHKMKSFQD